MKPLPTCREIIDFLDDYLAGDQPPEVRAEFDRHLAVCPPCVDYLKTYETTVALARSLGSRGDAPVPPSDAPEDLIRAILSARTKTPPSNQADPRIDS